MIFLKIGVISDTHGSFHFFEMAMKYLKDCDKIIHAGDILYHGPRNDIPGGYNPKELAEKINKLDNIIFAKGNCDSDVDQMVINHPIQSPYTLLEANNLSILITHGYTKSKEDMIEEAKKFKANILIYGHTHKKELEKYDSLIVLNPGSTSIPKDGSRSVAIIQEDEIFLLDIENNGHILSQLSIR